ncbi:MAG: hypothetical protein ACI9FO_001486, partial [Methylophagaceae bacterium]
NITLGIYAPLLSDAYWVGSDVIYIRIDKPHPKAKLYKNLG